MPLALFLGTRLALFVLAYLAGLMITVNRDLGIWFVTPERPFLDVWLRWDAGWYLAVAEHGYSEVFRGGHLPPVMPLFAAAVRLIGGALGDPPLAAVLVANVALAAAFVVLHRLVDDLFGAEIASRTLLFVCVFPFSFFGSAAYAESLVLLFAVSAFWAGRSRRPILAAVLAACAPLAGQAGLAVWPALLLDYFVAARRNGKRVVPSRALALLLLPPLALGAFAFYLVRIARLPIAAARDIVLGTTRYGLLLDGLAPLNPVGFSFGSYGLTIFLMVLMAGCGFLLVPWIARRLGVGFACYSLLLLVIPLVGATDALCRDVMLAFPVFIALASKIRTPSRETAVVVGSALLLGLFTIMFVAWYPVDRPTLAADPPYRLVHAERLRRLATWQQSSRPLGVELPNQALFWGYDLPTGVLRPGEPAPVVLHYSVLRPLGEEFAVEVRLRDSDGVVWGHDLLILDHPMRPSPDPNETIRHDFRPVIGAEAPSGVYEIELLAFEALRFESLDLIDAASRQKRTVALGSVVVLRPEDTSAIDANPPSRPCPDRTVLGEQIALRGSDFPSALVAGAAELAVAAYWEPTTASSRDYTVFVQLLNADGKVVAQSDAYPLAGRYPTSRWLPDIVVRDEHRLKLPAALKPGTYRLIIGMYDLKTMGRLVAISSAEAATECRAAGDFIELGAVEIRGR
jgi:hypothetical protein